MSVIAIELFVLLIEIVADFFDGPPDDLHGAEQQQIDRAIGLHGLSVQLVVDQRVELDFVADVEQIRPRNFVPPQSIDEFDQVIDANAVFGDVRRAGRPGVFALAECLPGNRPPSVPMRLATAVAHGTIDALNRRLARIDAAGAARGHGAVAEGNCACAAGQAKTERQRDRETGRWQSHFCTLSIGRFVAVSSRSMADYLRGVLALAATVLAAVSAGQ